MWVSDLHRGLARPRSSCSPREAEVQMPRWPSRRSTRIDPGSALLELLGKHDEDAAGAADIGELVHVLVGRHAAHRMAVVPRGGLERLVEGVDRGAHAGHADLVGPGGLRLDRVGVDVLEELEATVAVWRLEHGDLCVVAVEADGCVGPLSTDSVTAENSQAEVGEEGNRFFEVTDGDTDVFQLDCHGWTPCVFVR